METSNWVKQVMLRVTQKSDRIVNGFILFNFRLIGDTEFDQEACEKLLKDMIINKDNVLKYLERKYIPTYTNNGAIFKDQKCIQKVVIAPDQSLIIHIAKSEPHKIITDTIHVRNLLHSQGFTFTNKIKYFIEQIQIAHQDILLYNLLLKEWGMLPGIYGQKYEKHLLVKYGNIEEVVKIKKRSIKRKFLRWFAKREKITWKELRQVINHTDFTPKGVKEMSDLIRQQAKDRGVDVDF